MKKVISGIIVILLLAGCSFGKKVKEEEQATPQKATPVLNLAEVINSSVPDTFTWNSIARKVSIIPLETTTQSLFTEESSSIENIDGMILIADAKMNTMHCFDMNGKSTASFKHAGNGPGEYVYMSSVYVNKKDSTIMVYDNNSLKMIIYNQKGKFISEQSMLEQQINLPMFVTDDTLVCRYTGEDSVQIRVYTKDLKLVNAYFPHDSTQTIWEKSALVLTCCRSETTSQYILNKIASDTVFSINPNGCEPLFILKKGKYTYPKEEIPNFIRQPAENPYITRIGINAIPGYFQIQYTYQGRIAVEMWNSNSEQIITRTYLKPENNYKGGFLYTFDSGNSIRLRPKYIYGNKIAFYISADQICNEIEGIKEDDNPALMIIEM